MRPLPDSGKGCEACTKLIRLCSGLDFFPADPEVRRLLIDQLHRLAKDHQHAQAMVYRWLETEKIAPKVADLVGLSNQVRAASQEMPAGCSNCNGDPWVMGPKGMRRCDCDRGQALRRMDKRRDAGQAA